VRAAKIPRHEAFPGSALQSAVFLETIAGSIALLLVVYFSMTLFFNILFAGFGPIALI
jgi:hypothetical protein